jgi:hypothetical protein
MKKWRDGTASVSNNVSHVNGNMNGIVNIHGVVVMPTGQPSSTLHPIKRLLFPTIAMLSTFLPKTTIVLIMTLLTRMTWLKTTLLGLNGRTRIEDFLMIRSGF